MQEKTDGMIINMITCIVDEPIIAIDLGMTYSRVGIIINTKWDLLVFVNEYGNTKTPSVVAFTDEETHVGEAALN